MPKGPQEQKRPTDMIGVAILVGRIATGEAEDTQLSALNKAAFRPSEYRPTARAQNAPPSCFPAIWRNYERRRRAIARSHGRLSSKIMIFGQTVPDIMNWKLWVPFQILPARWFLHLLGARRSIVRPTAKVRQL